MKRKILVNEDFDDDLVRSYIEAGFEVHVRSKRKINKRDRKTYNKLKKVSLTEDNLRFGEVKELHDKYDYDEINITGNPIWDMLSVMGEPVNKYRVIKSLGLNNMEEAIESQSLKKGVDLKFVTVKVLYTYELQDGVSGGDIIPGTRDFCRNMIGLNKMWTLEELQSVSTTHLTKMGLPPDIITYRGGFWNTGDGGPTLPSCRHIFKAKVVIEP